MTSEARLVYGFGINDAGYEVTKYEERAGRRVQSWQCPYYTRWASMIQRCYHLPCQIKHPTYIGCSVADEWRMFSSFKSWMEGQDWAGKELDKDLLITGNRIYGPGQCCFIDRKLNCLVRESSSVASGLPMGIVFYPRRKKFRSRASCLFTNKRHHLGYFNTSQEASLAWLAFRSAQVKQLSAKQSDPRVAKAIDSLYSEKGGAHV